MENEPHLHRPIHQAVAWAIRSNKLRLDILELLLEYLPSMIEYNGTDDPLLHNACAAKPTAEMIHFLIDRSPDSIRTRNGNGRLPLHIACSRKVSVEIIEILLDYYPDAIRETVTERDHLNPEDTLMFPLHLALAKGASKEVIFLLLDKYPAAATHMFAKGQIAVSALALTVACASRHYCKDMDILQRLVRICPPSVRLPDYCGGLPLHRACFNYCVTLDTVEFLIGQYPDSVRIPTGRSGLLPLDLATCIAPLDVVEFLINAYPDALRMRNPSGELPIHSACRVPRHGELQLLIDAYGEQDCGGLRVAGNDGRIPLHVAVTATRCETEALLLLLEHFRDGIYVSDNDGCLPLHLACNRHQDVFPPVLETVGILVEADPYTTVIQKDNHGNTPYQLACQQHAGQRSHEVEMLLVDWQDVVVLELKRDFERFAHEQLGLLDLVTAKVWSFAKPDLWRPE